MSEISLAMTVLNEGASMPRFLQSVSQQRLKPAELVVVDGGSTDGTPEIIESWARESGLPLQLIHAPGANISEGRNRAFSVSRCEFVAVTDAGTVLEAGWLEELAASLEAGAGVASGFFRPEGESVMERA